MIKSTKLAILLTLMLVLGLTTASFAAFPDGRSIEIIVPYGAGGSTDQLTRAIDMVADKYFDVPVVVTNMSGGGGTLGFKYVADAEPDGHTVLISYGTGSPDMVGDHVVDLPYDPLEDFDPVCLMSVHSIILSSYEGSGIESLDDLKAVGEERGGVTLGIAGPVLFRIPAKVLNSYYEEFEITPVSFGGGSASMAALLGKHADMSFNHPSEVRPHLEAGTINAIAVALDERDPLMPDIPTFKELGYDIPEVASVKGLAVPAGTPDEAIEYIAEKMGQIAEDPDFKKKMNELGQPIRYLGTEDFNVYIQNLYKRYGELVDKFNIQ